MTCLRRKLIFQQNKRKQVVSKETGADGMQAFKSVKVANFHYKLCGWFRLQKSFCTGRKAYFPELTSFHLQQNKFVVKWFLSILVQYKWNWTFCEARILIRNGSMLSCLPSTEKLERSLVVDHKMSYCWSNDAAFKSFKPWS